MSRFMQVDALDPPKLYGTLKGQIRDGLPGISAHQQLAPIGRPMGPPFSSKPRQAAVLVLLYPDNHAGWRLLLIERASYPGIHSRQISFPGGKFEPWDSHLAETALREAEEETGVSRQAVSTIDWLSSLYIPPSHYQVYPLLAYMPYKPDLTPDSYEVATILPVPLNRFVADKALQQGPVTLADGSIVESPYFWCEGYCIWGATAMILNELLTLLKRQNLT